MKSQILTVFAFLCTQIGAFSQNHEDARHRVALVLGHSYISLDNNEVLAIPSFGLDYEYWFDEHFGLGIFSDVELITKEVSPEVNGKSIDREYPLVITGDLLWSPREHWEFVLGPGFVFEKGEVESLIRLGVEYDLALGHHWDVAPSLFYDQMFDGNHTIAIGIGIGKRF